jgi:hypothetical protein
MFGVVGFLGFMFTIVGLAVKQVEEKQATLEARIEKLERDAGIEFREWPDGVREWLTEVDTNE